MKTLIVGIILAFILVIFTLTALAQDCQKISEPLPPVEGTLTDYFCGDDFCYIMLKLSNGTEVTYGAGGPVQDLVDPNYASNPIKFSTKVILTLEFSQNLLPDYGCMQETIAMGIQILK